MVAINMGSVMQINWQSTVEDQGNWGLIRGLSIVECNWKEFFWNSEEYILAKHQWQQQQSRELVDESNIYELSDAINRQSTAEEQGN